MEIAKIDVVVPVFKGLQLTEACLTSVISASECAEFGKLIVVNDASPEEGMQAVCEDFVSRVSGELLVNEANRGFVASVNAGIRLSGDRDVVIVNSDTRLPPRWLERIARVASKELRCASITPFTNNGSICSYPNICEDNPLLDGLSLDEIDALFSAANEGRTVEIPTGVGFCMYLRRRALKDIGLFDEEAFGRGYGEENDWCLRATDKGWQHLLCADLFVYHSGGASFGDEAIQHQRAATEVIDKRYPDYHQLIADFIEADPAEPARHAVDVLRPDSQAVIAESRQRERTIRASRYELDRARHAQVVALDSLLRETRESANSEREKYEALLAKEREETSRNESRYQSQLQAMAAGYASLELQLQELSRFWPVRLRNRFLRMWDRK